MKFLLITLLIIPLSLLSQKELIRESIGGSGVYGFFCLDTMHCIGIDHNSSWVELSETYDQGETWSRKILFDLEDKFEGINGIGSSFILDDDHWYFSPWVNGDYMLFTEDGGETFNVVYLNIINGVDIYMYDTQKGILASWSNSFVTFDGWKTWEKIKLDKIGKFHNIIPRGDSTVYMTAVQNIPGLGDEWFNIALEFNLYTHDYEILYRFPDETEKQYMMLDRKIFHFYDENLGFFGGGVERDPDVYYDTDIIYRTTDGGHTWEKVLDQYDPPTWGLDALVMRDSLYGVLIGDDRVFETFDGGKTWEISFDDKVIDHFVMDLAFAGQKPLTTSDAGMFSWREPPELISPELILPAVCPVYNLTKNSQFMWKIADGSVNISYEIELAKDEDFTIDVIEIDNKTLNSYEIKYLKPGKEYFWRVRSVNDTNKSEWSETCYFTTKLDKARIIYPICGDSIDVKGIELRWKEVENASKYYVEISYDEDFENIISSDSLTANTLNIKDLDSDTTYFWRVKSGNELPYSGGDWSDVCSFTPKLYKSVEYNQEHLNIILYPNPVGDFLSFSADEFSFIQNKFQIIDMNGSINLEGKLSLKNKNNTFVINVSELTSGNYILRIGSFRAKFIKE